MSFQVFPRFLAVQAARAVRRRFDGRRLRAVLFCALGWLILGTPPAESKPAASKPAPPVTKQFESQPLDPYQREVIQQEARENTERYRVRIMLPQAAFAGPQAVATDAAGNPIDGATAAALAANESGESSHLAAKVACLLLGIGIWFFLARRMAPELVESLTGWLTSRSLLPSASATGDRMVALLAEEQAVANFQASLCGAPVPDAAEATAGDGADGNHHLPVAGLIRETQKLLQEAGRDAAAAAQRKFLGQALDRIHTLKNQAASADWRPLWQMSGAVEMLLKQLIEKSSNVTSSTLRTAAIGVTMLEELCAPGLKPELFTEPPLRLLAVDDEAFSRYALSHALKRGLTEPDVAEDGETAMAMAGRHAYDLIVLDVQLPGMDGFELCSKIHETVANRTTPVIFVTSLRDFDARANSILCGGRDLIAKPFLTFELTVKALTLVAGERLRGRARISDAALEELKSEETPKQLPEETFIVVGEHVAAQPVPEPVAAAAPAPQPAPAEPAVTAATNYATPATGFVAQAQKQAGKVRELVEKIRYTPNKQPSVQIVSDLLLGTHLLADNAEKAGQDSIALLASSMEGLLQKLRDGKSKPSPSAWLTLGMAADLLQDLCLEEQVTDLAIVPPIRVLVVDDDPVTLRAMSNGLQMKFSKPQCASDGKSALALAETRPFDVIFLDVQMPDMDGFEVCGRIRETFLNRGTPVVFVTSDTARSLWTRLEVVGGNDILSKPCLASELNLKALTLGVRGRMPNCGKVELQAAV